MTLPNVVNVDDAPSIDHTKKPWGGSYRVLTPTMRESGGSLGVNQTVCPPGCATVPFHWHLREDEVFFIRSGRGVFRYGDQLQAVGPGDCIACPAGTRVAHQLCNPFDEDLVYLAIGPYDPHEVCHYPDSGKVLVRGMKQVGFLRETPYMEGEPATPTIFELARAAGLSPADAPE